MLLQLHTGQPVSLFPVEKCFRHAGQSCVIVGVREDTSTWKGFSIYLLMFIHITDLDSNSPFSSSKTSTNSLLQKWCCRDGTLEFLEVNEFSIRYPQSSYFVLECSDCFQHVTWKLLFPLELQVESVRVTGMSVRRASCMIQCDPCCPRKCEFQEGGSETTRAPLHGTTILLHCASLNCCTKHYDNICVIVFN